ncbi:MAG TPA: hypothetical protein VJ456_06360, partial [Acidimicrobiia bacterium]|nr:hypothetical protein [Acidimicrobiia bacterium]
MRAEGHNGCNRRPAAGQEEGANTVDAKRSSRARMLGDLVAVAGCSVVVFALASHYQLSARLRSVPEIQTGDRSDALIFSLAVLA